jgi:hypothetical protein
LRAHFRRSVPLWLDNLGLPIPGEPPAEKYLHS